MCDANLCWLKQEEQQETIFWQISDNIRLSPRCTNRVDWDTWVCNGTGNITLNILSIYVALFRVSCAIDVMDTFVLTDSMDSSTDAPPAEQCARPITSTTSTTKTTEKVETKIGNIGNLISSVQKSVTPT